MCNACAFQCCGSDEFGGCGCDHCHDPACWADDDENYFGDDPIDESEPPAPLELKAAN